MHVKLGAHLVKRGSGELWAIFFLLISMFREVRTNDAISVNNACVSFHACEQ
jgi:hypothetical protein